MTRAEVRPVNVWNRFFQTFRRPKTWGLTVADEKRIFRANSHGSLTVEPN